MIMNDSGSVVFLLTHCESINCFLTLDSIVDKTKLGLLEQFLNNRTKLRPTYRVVCFAH